MSASTNPFMAMQPSRRMTSGWFEIVLRAQDDLLAVAVDVLVEPLLAAGETENAVAEAMRSLPESSRSSMPSWMTSV